MAGDGAEPIDFVQAEMRALADISSRAIRRRGTRIRSNSVHGEPKLVLFGL